MSFNIAFMHASHRINHPQPSSVRTLALQVLLIDHVHDLLGHTEVLDAVAADVALGDLPEAIAVLLVCLYMSGWVGGWVSGRKGGTRFLVLPASHPPIHPSIHP